MRVLIIGAGQIGSQLAVECLKAGVTVTVILRKGSSALANANQKFEDLDLWFTANWLDLSDCSEISNANIIIEATKEKIELKSLVLQQVASMASPNTLIATTTSSLSIRSLSESVSASSDFVGLHFFNPIRHNELLEVIVPKSLTEKNEDLINNFLKLLGKIPFYVPDTPGFVVNALLFPMLESSVRALITTNLTPLDIDTAMKSVCKHPMGPLELIDFIGVDTTLEILKNLQSSTAHVGGVLKYLERMIVEGKLGLKAKRGFYEYK